MVKVIASEVRKGNVLDIEGQLCTVMKAESVRPGKGTPTTHIDMRRISDGVKIVKSYRTTENVERAFLDEKYYEYLYEDDMGFNFMEPETFEQISISKDLIGDGAIWLQENMRCSVSMFEGVPVAIRVRHIRGRGNAPRWRHRVQQTGTGTAAQQPCQRQDGPHPAHHSRNNRWARPSKPRNRTPSVAMTQRHGPSPSIVGRCWWAPSISARSPAT